MHNLNLHSNTFPMRCKTPESDVWIKSYGIRKITPKRTPCIQLRREDHYAQVGKHGWAHTKTWFGLVTTRARYPHDIVRFGSWDSNPILPRGFKRPHARCKTYAPLHTPSRGANGREILPHRKTESSSAMIPDVTTRAHYPHDI